MSEIETVFPRVEVPAVVSNDPGHYFQQSMR